MISFPIIEDWQKQNHFPYFDVRGMTVAKSFPLLWCRWYYTFFTTYHKFHSSIMGIDFISHNWGLTEAKSFPVLWCRWYYTFFTTYHKFHSYTVSEKSLIRFDKGNLRCLHTFDHSKHCFYEYFLPSFCYFDISIVVFTLTSSLLLFSSYRANYLMLCWYGHNIWKVSRI